MMKDSSIEIRLNGFNERVAEGTTIAQLVEEHGEGDLHLIVERNGGFVYPATYAETRVEPGDDVELIHPDFGG